MNTKILVADESPTIHKIVAMAFENEGITVEGISRGEHVMEYMVEYQPHIVLVDIHLPGLNGYELCRQIKNFSSFKNTKVILLTSDFEDIDDLQLKVSQADDFISKPFKTEEILKKVKSQLNLTKQETEVSDKKTDAPQEPEDNEVIQNEFNDIVNKPDESGSDPIQQFFDENENIQPTIDEIDLETPAPANEKIETVKNEKAQTVEPTEEKLSEVMTDLSEEAFQAETRSVQIQDDELSAVFQSILSSPKSGLEESPQHEPGAKPNLIEETRSFMARHEAEDQSFPGNTTSADSDPVHQDVGDKIIHEHVKQVRNRLPEEVQNESSQDTLEQTVREILGEVAPKIIREVIQEEIETIKKMKET